MRSLPSVIVALCGCVALGAQQPQSPVRPITIRFRGTVDTATFACGRSYAMGSTGLAATPSDFRLYVYGVALVTATGKVVPVALRDDAPWQVHDLALLDFEDGSGPCSNGTPETRDFVIGDAKLDARDHVAGVRFTIGVPAALNHHDITLEKPPLTLSQMFWAWATGHKFLRVEVATTASNAIIMHLGSTGCAPSQGTDLVSCRTPNRPTIQLADFDPERDRVVVDIGALFRNADLDATRGGCMSEPRNAECAPMFGALGLAFGDIHATPQTVFRVEHADAHDAGAPGAALQARARRAAYAWQLPPGFPEPKVPADNPMSDAKVELGRHLFYDKRLSGNGTFACASCHQQQRGFADTLPRGIGSTGQMHPRNSMGLTNVAYSPVLTWANPLQRALETQALGPMFGEKPVELGLAGREQELVARLAADSRYQRMFAAAFPGDTSGLSLLKITRAIAAFERTLISGNSPYDRAERGDAGAMTASAKRGQTLFFSERLECFHCHGGINFTGTTDYVGKGFAEIEFHNTGLYNVDGKGAYPDGNQGVKDITGRIADMGRFKAPTLRNVAVTAPYMHDGSIRTLDEVIAHYMAGGRTIATGSFKGVGSTSPIKSGFVKGFTLSPAERKDLVAFLQSLTDSAFLLDKRLANPWPDTSVAARGTATP